MHRSLQIKCLLALIFGALLIGCSPKGKFKSDAFGTGGPYPYTGSQPYDRSVKLKNYVELIDGKKVYGENIQWNEGIAATAVKVDKQSIRKSQIKNIFKGGLFYHRVGKLFAIKLLAGKLNLYFLEKIGSYVKERYKAAISSRSKTEFYLQKGETAELKKINKLDDIRECIKDCPSSFEMLNKSDDAVWKEVKENYLFLNNVIITYNRCK